MYCNELHKYTFTYITSKNWSFCYCNILIRELHTCASSNRPNFTCQHFFENILSLISIYLSQNNFFLQKKKKNHVLCHVLFLFYVYFCFIFMSCFCKKNVMFYFFYKKKISQFDSLVNFVWKSRAKFLLSLYCHQKYTPLMLRNPKLC